MEQMERVAGTADVPISAWQDRPLRDTLWERAREACGAAASERGYTLAGGQPEERAVRYFKIADGPGGEPVEVETRQEDAEFARLRLLAWARMP